MAPAVLLFLRNWILTIVLPKNWWTARMEWIRGEVVTGEVVSGWRTARMEWKSG